MDVRVYLFYKKYPERGARSAKVKIKRSAERWGYPERGALIEIRPERGALNEKKAGARSAE